MKRQLVPLLLGALPHLFACNTSPNQVKPQQPVASAGRAVDYSYCATTTITWENPGSLENRCVGPWAHSSRTSCPPDQEFTGCFEVYLDPGPYRDVVELFFGTGSNYCLTRDEMPMESQSDARQKFDALVRTLNNVNNLPPYVDRPALRNHLIRRIKALFELRGNFLTQSQQTTALDLYLSDPSLKFACSGWDSHPLVGCGDLTTLNATMDMCYRMASINLAPSVAANPTRFNGCTDLIAASSALSLDTCEGQRYRDAYPAFMLTILNSAAQGIQADEQGNINPTDVINQLQRISRWYNAERNALYPIAQNPNPELLWTEVGQAVGEFWQVIYAKGKVSSIQPGADGGFSDAQIANMFQNGVESDRVVLRAALGSPPPLQGAALVPLLGYGFQSFADRLASYSVFHDMACRFKVTENGGYCRDQITEVSRLWRLLAASPNEAELTGILNTSGGITGQRWQNWKQVFQMLRDRHSFFRAAIKDAMGVLPTDPYLAEWLSPQPPVGGSVGDGDGSQLTTPPLGLSRLLRNARSRTNRYAGDGTLDANLRNTLKTGIQEQAWDDVVNLVRSRVTELRDEKQRYQAQRTQLITELLQQIRGEHQSDSILGEIDIKQRKFDDLSEDLIQMRINQEVETARFADFATAFNTVSQSEAVDPNKQISREYPSLSVTVADARFDNVSGFNDVAAVAIQRSGPWKLSMNPGEMLNFKISNNWNPACALSKSTMRPPIIDGGVGDPAPINVGDSVTGPEGWQVSWQTGSYQASSNTSVHEDGGYNTRSAQGGVTKKCSGGPISVSGCVGGGFFVSVSYCVSQGLGDDEKCTTAESGTTVRDTLTSSQSGGGETRWNAAFSSGLRLVQSPPVVPIPQLPAGALLAVQTRPGQSTPGDILDIQVLQRPYSSIVINRPADLYLVVNDFNPASDPACTGLLTLPPSLTVEMTRLIPAGAYVQTLGRAMASTLSYIRDQTDRYVNQGKILPTEVTAIREAAFSMLSTECHCEASTFPSRELLNLFSAWVSAEVAGIERKVEIKNLERSKRLLLMELEQTNRDFLASQEQSQLLRLLPAWTIKNLDGGKLKDKTIALLQVVTNYLWPIVDLRFKATLTSLDMSKVNPLLALNWDLPIDDIVEAVITAVEEILNKLAIVRLDTTQTRLVTVALSFRNPAAVGDPGADWRQVDENRASLVFSDLDKVKQGLQGFLSFRIEPNDLYFNGAAAAQFLCNEAGPVIRSMGLFFARPNQPTNATLNLANIRAPLKINPSLGFATPGLLKTYLLDNADWLNTPVDLVFGDPNRALTTFWDRESHYGTRGALNANGTSPFTTFDVTLNGLQSNPDRPLDYIDALVLVVQAEVKGTADLNLSPMCR